MHLVTRGCFVASLLNFALCRDGVTSLSLSNFDDFIINEGRALVQFFIQGCIACEHLVPTYTKAAAALGRRGLTTRFASIDAHAAATITQRYFQEPKSYFPALLYFHLGKPSGKCEDFTSERAIVNCVVDKEKAAVAAEKESAAKEARKKVAAEKAQKNIAAEMAKKKLAADAGKKKLAAEAAERNPAAVAAERKLAAEAVEKKPAVETAKKSLATEVDMEPAARGLASEEPHATKDSVLEGALSAIRPGQDLPELLRPGHLAGLEFSQLRKKAREIHEATSDLQSVLWFLRNKSAEIESEVRSVVEEHGAAIAEVTRRREAQQGGEF
mmetsp:Transcript_99298/g.280313  ORF Transcript_99298/g.280313 Transcript_99298/m.280313 type:complete len:328 (-) Transcript_99298:371-1354(-)